MATATLNDLKRRCEALGYELLGDNEPEQERGYYVLDIKTRTLPVGGMGTLEGVARWLDQEEQSKTSSDIDQAAEGEGEDQDRLTTSHYALIYSMDADVHDLLHGIVGIATTLNNDHENHEGLTSALHLLTDKLYNAVYDVTLDVQLRIARQIAENAA